MLLRGYEAGYMKDRDVNGEAIVEYQYYECPNCHGRFDYVNVVEKKEQCWEDYMDGDYREVYCDIKIVKYVCPVCSAKWSSSSKGLEKLRKRVRT